MLTSIFRKFEQKTASLISVKSAQNSKTTSLHNLMGRNKQIPDRAVDLYTIGCNHVERKEWKKAKSYFYNAILLDTTYIAAYEKLGFIFSQMKKQDEAVLCYSHILPESLMKEYGTSIRSIQDASRDSNGLKYIEIYPKSRMLLRSKPKLLYTQRRKVFPSFPVLQPSAFVCSVPKGKVVGDKLFNFAVMKKDGQIIEEVSSGSYDMLVSAKKKSQIMYKDESACIIAGRRSSLTTNYFHWMFDILPRLHLQERSIANFGTVDTYYFTQLDKPYIRETLKELHFPVEKIQKLDKEFHMQFKQLVVPSHSIPLRITKKRFVEVTLPKWICTYLRKQFLNTKHIKQYSEDDRAKRFRLYISREDAKERKVRNEKQVFDHLKRFGFIKVSLERLSVREQIDLFANAEIVVGPHGAGFTNLVFCRPRTKVVELFNPDYIRPMYFQISNHLNLQYSYFMGQNIPNKKEAMNIGEDMEVDGQLLTKALSKIGL